MSVAVAIRPPLDHAASLRPRLPLRLFQLRCSARSFGDPADDTLADAFVAEIFRSQRVRVGRCDGFGAAVSVVLVSRAPRADRLVHALVLDGVITRGHGEPRLWPIVEAPDDRELRAIARRVQARMLAWTGPGGAQAHRRGRVPSVQQSLVEGPPLTGSVGEPAEHRGGGPDPGLGGPRLRVRLARPLSGGTTHAVLSTRLLLSRLRGLLGSEASALQRSMRAHGLLWPVPAAEAKPGVVPGPARVDSPVRRLRDVAP